MGFASMITSTFKTGDYVVRRYETGALDSSGRYLPNADTDLDVTAVDTAADTVTIVAHDLATGDGPFWFSVPDPTVDVLPTPLDPSSPSWAIVVDVDTIKIAASKADAIALIAIDLTDIGLGAFPHLSNAFIAPGSVQALGDDELRDLPEGQSTEDMRTFFTIVELRERTEDNDPDVVLVDGKHFRVNRVRHFGTLSGGHYVSMLEKLEIL